VFANRRASVADSQPAGAAATIAKMIQGSMSSSGLSTTAAHAYAELFEGCHVWLGMGIGSRSGLFGAIPAILALWSAGAWAETNVPDLAPPWSAPGLPGPDPSAVAPFLFSATDAARDRAVECLTSAIYYEAGTQPREGQEAVAQVVLNRVRHPAFPKSVCGVVYQGVGGARACQFTFACDGSTARRPVAWRWDAARQVAIGALAGHVASGVGASTHYHTFWVHPYWPSLIETTRIGAHIFYHMPGQRGSAAGLTGQYSGDEPAAPRAVVSRPVGTSRSVGTPPPGAADFSVWGLPIATVSARQGRIVIKSAS